MLKNFMGEAVSEENIIIGKEIVVPEKRSSTYVVDNFSCSGNPALVTASLVAVDENGKHLPHRINLNAVVSDNDEELSVLYSSIIKWCENLAKMNDEI